MDVSVYSSCICNSPTIRTTHLSIKKRMRKQAVTRPYRAMPLSKKRERTSPVQAARCMNLRVLLSTTSQTEDSSRVWFHVSAVLGNANWCRVTEGTPVIL